MADTLVTIQDRLSKGELAPSSDFDLNQDIVSPGDRVLRAAAVMVALVGPEDNPAVLLTKRSSALRHHPGQIAFPGGKVDDSDASYVAAAQREAFEEVGLPQSAARLLGTLPVHETVTGFSVTPVVMRVTGPFDIVKEAGEVAEVFEVPFQYVTDPRNFQVQSRRWRGKDRHYYTVPYGPYYIWGATARILRSFAKVMQ